MNNGVHWFLYHLCPQGAEESFWTVFQFASDSLYNCSVNLSSVDSNHCTWSNCKNAIVLRVCWNPILYSNHSYGKPRFSESSPFGERRPSQRIWINSCYNCITQMLNRILFLIRVEHSNVNHLVPKSINSPLLALTLIVSLSLYLQDSLYFPSWKSFQ